MSQEKLNLEAVAEEYASFNGPSGAMCMDEAKLKLFAFIAGAKFREAQLMEIVNEMKETLKRYNPYCVPSLRPSIDSDMQDFDEMYDQWLAKETLTNVNKALNEMGIK